MKSLLLLAFVALADIPTAWSSQKSLEITCDYYKQFRKEYSGDFLQTEYNTYANEKEKENEGVSLHDYWVDLDDQKVFTSSFDHMTLKPTKQGDILVLSGEESTESDSSHFYVDTVKITINLKTMEAQASHKSLHVFDGIDSEVLGSNHYLFLDGKCRYEESFLDQY